VRIEATERTMSNGIEMQVKRASGLGQIWMRKFLLVLIGLTAHRVYGCDVCGCYTPQLEAMPRSAAEPALGQPAMDTAPHTWIDRVYFAVAEQFTHFGTVQVDGDEVANPTDQHLDSSITQLVAGYSFTPRFALQLNIPLIYRSFQRPEGFQIEHANESGLGDISLLGKYVLFHYQGGGARTVAFDDPKSPRMEAHEPDFTASALVIGGVKFPSGDTSRLLEEFHEVETPGAPESGIHGHDLTLGTGSFDGIFGGQAAARYKNFFAEADTQFTLRGDGDHQYHFANDLTWAGGPGYYLIRRHDVIVGVQCVCSGEHKDVDRFRGKPAEDTGITAVYLGPRIVASYDKMSFEVAAELPVSIDNTALQVVPDYRLRAAIAITF